MFQLWLLRLLSLVAPRLSVGLLYRLADAAAAVAWLASPTLRSTTRDHMRHVAPPSAPRREIDAAARGAVRSAARYYIDMARYAALRPEDSFGQIDAIEGVPELFAAFDRGRGVILASAHLGNPEFIAQALGPFFPTAVLTEPLEPPALHDYVHEVRSGSGVEFVPADRAGLRTALRHLRCGGVLGVLGDRDVLGTGEPFPFFGERAPLPRGTVELAWSTGAAIVVGFVVRSAPGRYRITLGEVEIPTRAGGSGDREADVEEGMRRFVAALEAGIRATPDQWFALSPIWSYALTESAA